VWQGQADKQHGYRLACFVGGMWVVEQLASFNTHMNSRGDTIWTLALAIAFFVLLAILCRQFSIGGPTW